MCGVTKILFLRASKVEESSFSIRYSQNKEALLKVKTIQTSKQTRLIPIELQYLPDQSIDFLGLNLIHLLDSILNLLLISTDINNKNQGVVILNLLHC